MDKTQNAVFRKSDGSFMFAEENDIKTTEMNVKAMGLSLESVDIKTMTHDELSIVTQECIKNMVDTK